MDKNGYVEICNTWANSYPESRIADKVKLMKRDSIHRILNDYTLTQPTLEMINQNELFADYR